MGKVLDRIQSSCLLQHLVQHNLISPHQFGFIPGKSTTMQLVYLIHRWLQALEKGHNITAVFLDFKKAFDRVWHHGLLHKLLACGISPKSVAWISSYLTNRQISVKVRNTLSEFHPITRGVPQGSHLGPILFIVFINDLIPSVAIPTEVYADDTTLHQQHQKTPNCQSYLELQDAITRTEEWALTWHGQFGHSKTKILTTNESNLQQAITPTIEKQPIAIVRDHRHLGITLTSDLNWSSHVQSLVSMASKRSGLLRLMSHQLPRAVTIRLFKSYVRPTMEYASAVWHGSLKEEDALSIERIQAGVARCLLKADWCTPKPTLLEQLDWPALRWRREIASLTFFHKIIQRQLPPLTDCLFPFAHSVSNRSQRKPLQLLLPQTRSTRFTKSFFYRSALLWNSLPSCIQEISSSTKFRKAIEDHWTRYKYITDTNIPIPLSSAL